MEPHRPYQLSEEFIPSFSPEELKKYSRFVEVEKLGKIDLFRVVSLYDASIAQNDKSFGDLIAELKKLDLYDETLIILMSDHGEQFYEHGGFAHGQNLYQETIRNLLAVKLPHQLNAGREVWQNVQEIDLLPTLLDMAGVSVPRYCSGSSLSNLLLSSSPLPIASPREIFLETGLNLNMKAIVDGDWKLIHTGKDWSEDIREYELFHLPTDPREEANLIASNPASAPYLKQRLLRWVRAQKMLVDIGREEIEKTLTKKEIEELKALGYIK